jgi:glucose/arabinose dehydrogenase
MPAWQPHSVGRGRVGLAIAGAALVAACSSAPAPSPTAGSPAPPAQPAGLTLVTLQVPDGLGQAPLDTPRQVLIPPGWTMSVWDRIPKARLAAWTPDGALLVSVPASGEVVRLAPRPDGGEPGSSILLFGLSQPHGLAFIGSTLYVAGSNQVDAYIYTDGKTSGGRTVAPGLPDAESPELQGAYAHALKSVAVGADGAVYFSIGSTGNITPEDRTANPPRATIMRIPPGDGTPQVFATGVRNGTGLAIAPDGSVWTAVNNRDQVAYPYDRPYDGDSGSSLGTVIPEYVNDHPPESIAKLWPGRELGWPFCNPDTDVNPGVADSPQDPAHARWVLDVQTNADGSKLNCDALPPVEQTMGAHAAPLGMSFTDGALPGPYGSGALIGVHGSWNRTPPRPPEVSFYPWRDGTLGDQQTLVGGFQLADGSRWGRPVAAVVGPDGAVYITDDYAGAVYRLAPPGR